MSLRINSLLDTFPALCQRKEALGAIYRATAEQECRSSRVGTRFHENLEIAT